MNPLLTASATRLAGMVRTRQVSSREVVEAHVERIRSLNPTLNAMVADRFSEALAEADAADRRVGEEGPEGLPPLLGVPCSIKESFALRGMPWTSGLVARTGVVAEDDATAVSRLRAAGAIPLGVTNTSELCMWMETYNRVYGRTNNPYDRRRIVGGSSGGEGAIVGAGGTPFGLGADVGGSIRMPAFFNGVFGHKPTGGLVPNSGQFPIAEGEGLRYLTTGPIARRAEDLMPLLRILAGPDGLDDRCQDLPLGDPAEVDLSELTVLDVEGNGANRVAEGLRAAQRRAAEALESKGAKVVRTRIEGLRSSFEMWSTMLSRASETSYSTLLGNGTAVNALRLLPAWLVRRSPHTLPSIALALGEHVAVARGSKGEKVAAATRALREEISSRLGPMGVMLYPSHSRPAPRHRAPLLTPTAWVYTAILNVLEFPATQVPLGLDRRGIPLGVQVVANHGRDHVSIAVALALEEAFGGWVPPPATS